MALVAPYRGKNAGKIPALGRGPQEVKPGITTIPSR